MNKEINLVGVGQTIFKTGDGYGVIDLSYLIGKIVMCMKCCGRGRMVTRLTKKRLSNSLCYHCSGKGKVKLF